MQGVTGSSPVPSTKQIPWSRKALRDFLLPPKPFDPLSDPLQVENLCNEALHALGTCGSHVICKVTVDVQSERCRGMAEIALHGFDVISSPDTVNGVGVPQIMDSGGGNFNLIDHAFEAVI